MSYKATELVKKHSKARGVARLVLWVLADHCNGKHGDLSCWPSLKVLAQETKLAIRTVCRNLARLEAIGDIQRKRSKGGYNRRTQYVICCAENSVPRVSVNSVSTGIVCENENSVPRDARTVSPETDAINRNITGKRKSAQRNPSLPLRVITIPKKSARRPPATIPEELKPAVERIIAKINELAGTGFKPDSKIVLGGLLPRLKAGATEGDCLLVVEDRWRRWGNSEKMSEHFNPETLFRETNFDKYLNAARQESAPVEDQEWRKRTFYNA